MQYAKVFADNVRCLLAKRQIRFSTLARMCGISQGIGTKLNNPERLNPRLDIMENIADKLEVPLEQLLTPDLDANLEDLEKDRTKEIRLPKGYKCGFLILRDEEFALAKRQDERNRILIKLENEIRKPT